MSEEMAATQQTEENLIEAVEPLVLTAAEEDQPALEEMPVVTYAPPVENAAQRTPSGNIDMLMDVSLLFTVELGRTQLTVRQVLDLQKGSVVELDRVAGEAVDIYVNEHMMARGEVVVVDDKFGVRITELVQTAQENNLNHV